jgi:hypothetical protein
MSASPGRGGGARLGRRLYQTRVLKTECGARGKTHCCQCALLRREILPRLNDFRKGATDGAMAQHSLMDRSHVHHAHAGHADPSIIPGYMTYVSRADQIAASIRKPRRTHLLEERVDGPPRGKRMMIWLPACPDYTASYWREDELADYPEILPNE